MTRGLWTATELAALQAAIGHVSQQPFQSLSKFGTAIESHMIESQVATKNVKQILSRLTTLARKSKSKTTTDYVRSLFSTESLTDENRDEMENEVGTPSISDLSEMSDAPSQNEEPARPLEGIILQPPQLPPRPRQQASANLNDIPEGDLQAFYRYRGYDQPPLHTTIKHRVRQIMRDLDVGIDCVKICHSVSNVSSKNLNSAAVDLSKFILRHKQPSQLTANLDNLFSGPGLNSKIVMRMYGAAALCAWVFHDFDSLPFTLAPHDLFKNTLLFEALHPDTRKMMDTAEKVHWLKNSVKPTLLGHAENCRKDLLDVLVSLALPAGLQQQDISESGVNQLSTFENREGQTRLWMQKATSAFHAALELKLDLEVSNCFYEFKFPALGDKFEDEWMQATHTLMGREIPKGSKVYACLQPAIISMNRDGRPEDAMAIVKAVVMVEGYGVEWSLVIA